MSVPKPSEPTRTAAQPTQAAPRCVQNPWQAIDEALSPVIGPRAVQALFQRSIHLSKQAHPELAISLDAELPLSNQVLLQTFRQLLGELIGPALSELLLQPALDRQL